MSAFASSLIASTIFDTTLSVFGAKMKAKAYQAQEQQSITNALENRRIALFAGRAEADRIRKKGRLLTGIDIGKTAGSGIALSGSALDVVMQNVNEYENDADMAIYNANLKGNAYMREGLNKASAYANAEAGLPLETATHIAGTIFNSYSKNEQNKMADLRLQNEKDNIRSLTDLTYQLRNKTNKEMYGSYYNDGENVVGDFENTGTFT